MKHAVVLLFFSCFLSPLFSQNDFKALDQVLASRQKDLGGKLCMLVYKDGKVVYEKNMGYTSSSKEAIASCSKWITAAMVMTFVEEGKLKLEDTIGKYLPEFSKNKKGHIKLWHCLSHTTGIQGEQITVASIMNRNKYASLKEEVSDFALKPMVAKPGEQFFYSNIGLNIAGRILEVVSGKDFETIFQEKIAKPLSMTNTTFVGKQAINPSGSATSTPFDYMNFLIMILNKGEFKGKRLLKKESIEKMQESATEDVRISVIPEQAEGLEYGLGEWILEFDDDGNTSVVSSPGVFGTFPYVDIGNEYAAILFVKTLNFKERKQIYAAVKEAVDKSLE